jgi:hypothetical protein
MSVDDIDMKECNALLAECILKLEGAVRTRAVKRTVSYGAAAVHQYLERQGDLFFKRVFDKFAERCIGTIGDNILESERPSMDDSILEPDSKNKSFVRTDGLQRALLELGVQMKREKVEELIVAMDLDENGGLDFEEFKRAVQQPPTQLEQWASMLPLAGMLARSLPVSAGPGDQPLRGFSRLDEHEIDTAVELFSGCLRLLLIKTQATLRHKFDSMDKKASEDAKDSAGGFSAASKFKTFKMSTGKVSEYHDGLSSRIGTSCYDS